MPLRALYLVLGLLAASIAINVDAQGTLLLGAWCDPNVKSCAPGLYCNSVYYKCAAQGSWYDKCTSDDSCLPPLICIESEKNAQGAVLKTCQALSDQPGDPCSIYGVQTNKTLCAPYLLCDGASNLCITQFGLGTRCSPIFNDICERNLFCAPVVDPAVASVCVNKLPSGSCTADFQCITNNCTRSQCLPAKNCTTSACSVGYYCRLSTGYCEPLLQLGVSCTTSSECQSGICKIQPGELQGYCSQCDAATEGLVCGLGQYCEMTQSGISTCKPAAKNGAPCTYNRMCGSNFCDQGLCSFTWNCTNDMGCWDVYENITIAGYCQFPSTPPPPPSIKPPFQFCIAPTWCRYRWCTCDTICGGVCEAAPWTWGPGYPWFANYYSAIEEGTLAWYPDPYPTWAQGYCNATFPWNQLCLDNSQCSFGAGGSWCSPNTNRCTPACMQGVDCPLGYVCSDPSSTDYVDCLANTALPCLDDAQCDVGLICSSVNGNRCSLPGAPGSTCSRNPECDSTNVCVNGTCVPYDTTVYCTADKACTTALCNLETHKCISGPQNVGFACARGLECASNRCDPKINRCQ